MDRFTARMVDVYVYGLTAVVMVTYFTLVVTDWIRARFGLQPINID